MTQPLDINAVSAHYGTTKVLEDLSLSVQAGELVSLLGASGCGKTTTLRLIAGFLSPTGGSISARRARPDAAADPQARYRPRLPELRPVPASVRARQRRVRPEAARASRADERRKRAMAMLERVGLAALADRAPGALSGGQKQRVALARALVIEPPLLMFDEPLSNLDAKLRVDMRVEIRQLQRANGTTSVYVTHDQEEAFSISDRVAIMNAGRLMQFDRPEVLYRRPANTFVARFVGFENIIPLKVVARDGDIVTAETAGMRLRLSQAAFGTIPDTFLLATRPDGLVVSTDPAAEGLPAQLGLRTYLGRAYQYQCETPAGHVVANGSLTNPLEAGTNVKLVPVPEQCTILAAEEVR